MPPKKKPLDLGLSNISSNPAFWQALGSEQVHVGCACHNVGDYQISGEKQQALKTDIDKALQAIASNPTSEDLTLIYVLLKMQDQIAMGKNFASKRTLEFARAHKITFETDGVKIGDEVIKIDDAAGFLREKYQLNSTQDKISVVRKSQEKTFTKLQRISDVAWEDFVNQPLRFSSQKASQNLPSIATVILFLGTLQLLLRMFNQQKDADNVRDNVGAASEMAAFFVVANLLLENLAHSFVLAAPAFGTTLAYDKIRKYLQKSDREELPQSEQNSTMQQNILLEDIEAALPAIDEKIDEKSEENPLPKKGKFPAFHNPVTSLFCDTAAVSTNNAKEKNLLRKVQNYLAKEELWLGLRKWQLAYQDNKIEDDIKFSLNEMLADKQLPNQSPQDLCDILHLLKSLAEVYSKNNNAGEINSVINEFVEHFGHDGTLLYSPSFNAREAAFCCRAHYQLVGFNERVSNSLPHLPSGSQVILAGLVVAGIYSAKAIYEATTGEKEVYSNYVTDFPDHLFNWLQLGQMYKNIGGDASLAQPFRDFFASFNLAENSTHLGIALAPFFAYAQNGDKIFTGMHHKSANLAAYLHHSAGYYFDKISSYVVSNENQKNLESVIISADKKKPGNYDEKFYPSFSPEIMREDKALQLESSSNQKSK